MGGLNYQQTIRFSVYSESFGRAGMRNPYTFKVGLILATITGTDAEEIKKIIDEIIPLSTLTATPSALYKIEMPDKRVLYTSSGAALTLLKKICDINERLLVESGLTREEAECFTSKGREHLKVSLAT